MIKKPPTSIIYVGKSNPVFGKVEFVDCTVKTTVQGEERELPLLSVTPDRDNVYCWDDPVIDDGRVQVADWLFDEGVRDPACGVVDHWEFE